MSLLNEALKRASQTQKGRGTEPAGGIPMRHAQSAPSRKLPILLQAAVMAAVLLAAFFVWKGWQQRGGEPTTVLAEVEQTTRPAPRPTVPIEPSETLPPPAESEMIAADASEEESKAPPTEEPVLELVSTPSPPPAELVHRPPIEEFPQLRLQGIFYRPSDPSVLINGRILTVGDVFDDIRLDKIDPQSVTVEWYGHVRTVYLGGH